MNSMDLFCEGQRWTSETEPELGLGTLARLEGDRVHILFPACGELRQYAIANAPLKRVQFKVGDTIQTHDGRTLKVDAVRDTNGLLTYLSGGQECPEPQLSDTLSVHGPDDRLLQG